MAVKNNKRKYGQYYTSAFLAEELSRVLFTEFFKEEHSEISILDPACGNGVFLAEAVNQLEKNITSKKTSVSLCGIDINKKAVDEAVHVLNRKTNGNTNISFSVNHGDTLTGKISANKKQNSNSNLYLDIANNTGFDIIIGNPPWVSLFGKHAQNIYSNKQIDYLLTRYPCDKYRPNLFEMFIWRSLELLKPEGILAFIVPDRLFHNAQYINLRKKMFSEYQLTHIIHGAKFKDVKSDNLMFLIRNKKPNDKDVVRIKNINLKKFEHVKQSVIHDGQECNLLFMRSDIRNILTKIETNILVRKLSEYFNSGVGFIGIKDKITRKRISINQLKVITGRDIAGEKINKNRYFDFNYKNLLGGTLKKEKLLQRPKIVLRKTGSRLISAIDFQGYIPEQSLYFITPKDNSFIQLLFLKRLLSSEIINFYYINAAITNINTTPHLKKNDLDKFPVIPFEHVITSLALEKKCGNIEEICASIEKLPEESIYRLYKITPKEQKIIENYLKEN